MGIIQKHRKRESVLSTLCLAIVLGVFVYVFTIHAVDTGSVFGENSSVQSEPEQQSSGIEGLAIYTPKETYNPDTLYEKINGKAPLYTDAGFVSLDATRYQLEGTNKWFEAEIFTMSSPESAFYVFSVQRRPEAIYDGIEDALIEYRTENSYFRFAGDKYCEFVGAEASDELMAAMMKYGRNINADSALPAALAPLQKSDMFDRSSIKLSMLNTFGAEGLNRIMIGQSGDDTFFWRLCDSEEQAKECFGVYTRFMANMGMENTSADANTGLYDMFGVYELFTVKGKLFVGVHEAVDVDAAKTGIDKLSAMLTGDGK
ncbi:MAG: DUF6599 family protein [Phycisphaerae bacterium]|jgi:hypothetical protein